MVFLSTTRKAEKRESGNEVGRFFFKQSADVAIADVAIADVIISYLSTPLTLGARNKLRHSIENFPL